MPVRSAGYHRHTAQRADVGIGPYEGKTIDGRLIVAPMWRNFPNAGIKNPGALNSFRIFWFYSFSRRTWSIRGRIIFSSGASEPLHMTLATLTAMERRAVSSREQPAAL